MGAVTKIQVPETRIKNLVAAADNADWQQVALNCSYGPPCFHYEADRKRFCLRAKGWHDAAAEKMFHKFLPLSELIAGRSKG